MAMGGGRPIAAALGLALSLALALMATPGTASVAARSCRPGGRVADADGTFLTQPQAWEAMVELELGPCASEPPFGLRLALVAGPEAALQRRVAELVAEGRDDEEEGIVHVDGGGGKGGGAQGGDGHDVMRLANAIRDHLQVHGHGHAHTAFVVDSAEALSAGSVDAALRPLEGWSAEASAARAAVRGSFMGAEFSLQSITAIFVMDCAPEGLPAGKGSCAEFSGAAASKPLHELQAVLRRPNGPVPEPLRKVLFRYRTAIVPLVDASGHWQAVARAALVRRYEGAGGAASAPSANGGAREAIARQFVGQREAVSEVAARLEATQDDDFSAALDGSPLVLAFLGPSGVGKTELAKLVAKHIHRPSQVGPAAGGGDGDGDGDGEGGVSFEALEASGKVKRFAMNQYQNKEAMSNLLGADKGYQGQCNGALTEALRRVPDVVVILDEFEKAHESFLGECAFLRLASAVHCDEVSVVPLPCQFYCTSVRAKRYTLRPHALSQTRVS